jgi:hypothetical protein
MVAFLLDEQKFVGIGFEVSGDWTTNFSGSRAGSLTPSLFLSFNPK